MQQVEMGIINEAIRRTNRNLLLASLIGGLIAIGFFVFSFLFLPEYEDAAGEYNDVRIITLIIGLAILGVCIYGLVKFVRRMGNPALHPIMQSLLRFGEPERVISEVENDLMMGADTVGELLLSSNWLIHSSRTKFSLTRLSDIVWAYMTITTHSRNGVNTGTTTAVYIWDRHGDAIVTERGPTKLMMNTVLVRAPWAFGGYTDELNVAWNSTDGRTQMVAAVDQRRKEG